MTNLARIEASDRRKTPIRPLRLPALVAALMCAALVVTGCGGEEEVDDEPLTEDEYVVEVREAIGPVASESQELITQATEAQQVEDLRAPLGEAQRVYQGATDRLAGLEPPTDVEELHEDLVDTQQDIADAAAAAEQAAREGDRRGLERFRRAGDRYRERAEALAQEFSERGIEF